MEAILSEELDKHDSVLPHGKQSNSAARRFGLAHPQKISLYKRVEKLRQRLTKSEADANLAGSIALSQGKQVR